MEKNYLKIYLSFLLLGSISVIFFNWLVNPYSLYESPEIKGFNKEKVEYIKHLRLTKTRIVTKRRVDTIIIGTSRAGRGLSPNHPVWANDNVYNMALPGAGIYEMYRYIQHAYASHPLKTVVLALDFRSFHDEKPGSAFLENRLLVNKNGSSNNKYIESFLLDSISTLFSIDALGTSLKTIREQGWNKETLFPKGRWDRTDENVNHRKLFSAYTRSTIQRLKENIQNNKNRPLGLQHYRNLISFAHNNNIELVMIISPSHAWHWEAYRAMKLQENFDDLKRSLVTINNEEAKKSGDEAFPLWDFSGHNSISIENVPSQNEKEKKMKWFWESVHYKKRLGDIILDKILGNKSPEKEIPIDFGVRLNSSNIEAHISYLQEQSRVYRKSHSSDIGILKKLLQSEKINTLN